MKRVIEQKIETPTVILGDISPDKYYGCTLGEDDHNKKIYKYVYFYRPIHGWAFRKADDEFTCTGVWGDFNVGIEDAVKCRNVRVYEFDTFGELINWLTKS